ncbi:MAG: hypothetical protein ACPGAN_01885 [Candidatus Poseidoniaceae archaeon]
MKFLASGSEKRVAIPLIAGVLILLISTFVDDVYGFATLIGISLLLQGCLLVNAYRDPQRKIKIDKNLIYTPIDGTLEISQKEVLVGYRPSKQELGNEKHIIDQISGDWIIDDSKNLDFSTEFLWREHRKEDGEKNTVFRIRIRKTFLDMRTVFSPISGKIIAQELRLPTKKNGNKSKFEVIESDYGARLRMVIKSEDSGLVEMLIHSKAEAFDPYVFENDSVKQGDKLCLVHSNGMWVDIRVLAEDWNLSSLKSSNTLEAGLDSIFVKNGDEEE